MLKNALRGHEPVPGRTRSELERRMYRLCRREGIEVPETNQLIEVEGDIYEVDCLWSAHRLIVECDSRWHDNPVSGAEDALRDQILTLHGWRVHRLRWAQIVGAPERAARTIQILIQQQQRLIRAA